jgi:hypothetical protein
MCAVANEHVQLTVEGAPVDDGSPAGDYAGRVIAARLPPGKRGRRVVARTSVGEVVGEYSPTMSVGDLAELVAPGAERITQSGRPIDRNCRLSDIGDAPIEIEPLGDRPTRLFEFTGIGPFRTAVGPGTSLSELRELWATAWHTTPNVFAFSGAGGPLELGRAVDSVGDEKITVDVTDVRAKIFLKVKLPDKKELLDVPWNPMAVFLALQREVAEVYGTGTTLWQGGREITAEMTYWNNVDPGVPIQVRSGGPDGTRVYPFKIPGVPPFQLQFESTRPIAEALDELERREGKRPTTLTVSGSDIDLEGMSFADVHEMVWAGVRFIHRIHVGLTFQ